MQNNTQTNAQNLYERRGKFYHNLFIDFLGLGRRFEKFFRKSKYIMPDIRVLDAGCGSGALLTAFHKVAHERGFKNIVYHGFDLTQTMLDHFSTLNKDRGIKDIELSQANILQINQLPGNWRNYDLAISNGVFEYIPEPDFVKALQNLKSLLKKDGVLIIFATKKNILTKFFIEWWWKARTFNVEQISTALHSAGFNKITISNFGPVNNMFFIEAKV